MVLAPKRYPASEKKTTLKERPTLVICLKSSNTKVNVPVFILLIKALIIYFSRIRAAKIGLYHNRAKYNYQI